MASITKTRRLDADTAASVGTLAALAAFALAVFRLIVQTHVEGGYDLFAGSIGAAWMVNFVALVGVSCISFFGSVVLMIKGE